ncbi:unnamed protein product [Ceratitis capitata]|uniref:(Mediterranean fruit fly) hypothetical protein n=1 Tax=Ceratitis capitata TaxID=7213 RepID=A0A811UZS5_CERCA|nr:unnamed protein product [Ceratitis capitata]
MDISCISFQYLCKYLKYFQLIQTETKCKLLEANLNDLQNKFDSMQEELLEQRINSAKETEHWQTISALFVQSTKDSNTVDAEDVCNGAEDEDKVELVHQTPKQSTVATNTETPVPAQRKLSDSRTPVALKKKPSVDVWGGNITLTYREKNGDEGECTSQETTVSTSVLAKAHEKVEYRSIQTETDSCIELGLQEDDTLSKKLNQKIAELQESISQRDLELKGCKNELHTCNKQIEELQGRLNLHKSSDEATSDVKANTESSTTTKNDIIEKTIISFHTLLSEKDKAISKYQDILQSEREQIKITTNQLNNDIENLKSTITNLNFNIKTKDLEILELKTKLEVVSVRKNSAEKLDLATEAAGGGSEESGDNSLNELTDEKIEEMFEQVPTPESTGTQNIVESAAKKNKQHLEKQNEETLKDLKEKACYWEKMLTVRRKN